MRSGRRRLFALLLAIAVPVVACFERHGEGAPCELDEECPDGLVCDCRADLGCRNRYCYHPCLTSKECPDLREYQYEYVCLQGTSHAGLCETPTRPLGSSSLETDDF